MALWGLPPVDLHGPLHRLGIMDPVCGGTRSAYFAVSARWALAWYYNRSERWRSLPRGWWSSARQSAT